jgi:hypothetical protein
MSALTLAQANLVQAQAVLAQQHTAFLARMADIDARMSAHKAEIDARRAETNRINSERFARIEAILMEHSRILRALPDAIRDKIGFNSPPPPNERRRALRKINKTS